MKYCYTALSLLMGTFAASVASAQNYSFAVIQDGLSPTTIQRAYSITDSGTILLQPFSAQNQSATALLITGGTIQKTEQYNPSDQYFSLSNAGYLTGFGIGGVYVVDDVHYNQTFITIPTGDTAYPTGINTAGLVVGMANSPTSASYGWTWKAGTFEKFTFPQSTGCSLNGVNDNGDVVGTFFTNNKHDQYYAFARIGGHDAQFSAPGCIDPNPSAISRGGIVVGTALVEGSNPSRTVGFVRSSNRKVTVIDYKKYAPASITSNSLTYYLSSVYSTEVCGVNASGKIVGMFSGTYVTKDGKSAQNQYIPFLGTPR